eukprot:TRINITY_DN13543_c0_g1_i3.p1 TRINITY_DN13543_c0_g1~~TRINITY_DN13543_c0_g1_i3.p1  ORF type:complete len:860 (-),score=192.23 TRINITY_DN13543_c0_g1_i3:72-2651(-)
MTDKQVIGVTCRETGYSFKYFTDDTNQEIGKEGFLEETYERNKEKCVLSSEVREGEKMLIKDERNVDRPLCEETDLKDGTTGTSHTSSIFQSNSRSCSRSRDDHSLKSKLRKVSNKQKWQRTSEEVGQTVGETNLSSPSQQIHISEIKESKSEGRSTCNQRVKKRESSPLLQSPKKTKTIPTPTPIPTLPSTPFGPEKEVVKRPESIKKGQEARKSCKNRSENRSSQIRPSTLSSDKTKPIDNKRRKSSTNKMRGTTQKVVNSIQSLHSSPSKLLVVKDSPKLGRSQSDQIPHRRSPVPDEKFDQPINQNDRIRDKSEVPKLPLNGREDVQESKEFQYQNHHSKLREPPPITPYVDAVSITLPSLEGFLIRSLTGEILDPRGEIIIGKIVELPENVYIVHFRTTSTGRHKVSIKSEDGRDIFSEPVIFDVKIPAFFKYKESILPPNYIPKDGIFVKIDLRAPNNQQVDCQVIQKPNGFYALRFAPRIPGCHFCQFLDAHESPLSHRPFEIYVMENEVSLTPRPQLSPKSPREKVALRSVSDYDYRSPREKKIGKVVEVNENEKKEERQGDPGCVVDGIWSVREGMVEGLVKKKTRTKTREEENRERKKRTTRTKNKSGRERKKSCGKKERKKERSSSCKPVNETWNLQSGCAKSSSQDDLNPNITSNFSDGSEPSTNDEPLITPDQLQLEIKNSRGDLVPGKTFEIPIVDEDTGAYMVQFLARETGIFSLQVFSPQGISLFERPREIVTTRTNQLCLVSLNLPLFPQPDKLRLELYQVLSKGEKRKMTGQILFLPCGTMVVKFDVKKGNAVSSDGESDSCGGSGRRGNTRKNRKSSNFLFQLLYGDIRLFQHPYPVSVY